MDTSFRCNQNPVNSGHLVWWQRAQAARTKMPKYWSIRKTISRDKSFCNPSITHETDLAFWQATSEEWVTVWDKLCQHWVTSVLSNLEIRQVENDLTLQSTAIAPYRFSLTCSTVTGWNSLSAVWGLGSGFAKTGSEDRNRQDRSDRGMAGARHCTEKTRSWIIPNRSLAPSSQL